MSKWTHSLRPPIPADGPFYLIDFGVVAVGDAELQPLPKTTQRFERVARRFPDLALQAELEHLCGKYIEEILSALAAELKTRLSGIIPNHRPKSSPNKPPPLLGGSAALPPWKTGQFASVVQKYSTLPLADEVARLCSTIPAEPLAALADALRASAAGSGRRGAPRKAGTSGPPAPIRAKVQARRLSGIPDSQIAREIEDSLPRGASDGARRKRAYRTVDAVQQSTNCGVKVPHVVAVSYWATHRARRQLDAAVRRGVLTREEALQKEESRKWRFMSRVQAANIG